MIVVTAEEMRALDEQTIRGLGVPGVVLMESAGRGVVEVIAGLGPIAERPIAVVAGPGNNGGDGFVIARHLHNRGGRVELLLATPPERVAGDARIHFEAMKATGVRVSDAGPGWVEEVAQLIDQAELIVDALLGTGGTRPVEGHYARLIERMNAARGIRVAVDVPSGLDCNRGHPLGVCVRAHHTVTFAFPKLGLVTAPGFTFAGQLHVVDIGIPPRLGEAIHRRLLDDRCLAPLVAPRPATSHKGTFGHVLVIAGSLGHPGAALMTGEAAARAGAGLTTIASPEETARALASHVRELSLVSLGPEPLDPGAAWPRLEEALQGKNAVALGPGVPRTPGMRALLERLLGMWTGPLVIDADGLNLLAEAFAQGRDPLAGTRARIVVTPHPAEMGRLLSRRTDEVQADRVAAAHALAESRSVVAVLKGARTIVAASDGRLAINPTGNPGLASGGTGDVLTGVIGALLAAGLDPFDAACAGAYLHGRAADLARDEIGEAGLLARDVIARLPRARYGANSVRSF